MTALRVAVDFGTSNTCAVLAIGAGPPEVVLVDGAPVMPSAVYAPPQGALFVGQEAQRQAAIDPARYEPHPKRRIDETELLLGDTVVPVLDAVRAVLARMVDQARAAAAGAPVDQLVLTHPAEWGAVRSGMLRTAGLPLAREVVLVPEPVAAAWCHATEVRPDDRAAHWWSPRSGSALAVVDLGGGTADVSIVRRSHPGGPGDPAVLTVPATRGDPALGGVDIDQLLFEHVGSIAAGCDPAAWSALADGTDLAARRAARALRSDVRTAKETLSRHPYADVPLPPPFPDVHLTREELERLIAPLLARVPDLLDAALSDTALSDTGPSDTALSGTGHGRSGLGAVFLIGGSSRIPLVARLLQDRTGLHPSTLELPETAVPRGALSATRVPEVERRSPRPADSVDSADSADSSPHPEPAGRARRRRGWLVGVGVGAGVVGGVAAGVVAGVLGPGERGADREVGESAYTFTLPVGWEPVRGDRALRETRLFPAGSRGTATVLVQENPLGYDSSAQPTRPHRDLRGDLAAAPPGRYSGFDPGRIFADREVVFYREHPADGSMVDWFVLFRGYVQVSVGCRHDGVNRSLVGQACHEVVRTLRIRQ